jgi:hypothetical protein
VYKIWCVTYPWLLRIETFLRADAVLKVEDSTLSNYIFARLPDLDPLSNSSLNQIRNWIEKCNTSHSACASTFSSMPTRIIDIGQYDESGVVKLIESSGRNGQYAALSHCWGTSKSFTTTTKTLDQRKREICVEDLPKTFQDAIRVTNLLQLQYLWIDSICIIQDDTNDWEEQSSHMSAVYSNSYITIAATRAADDGEGFLGMRSKYLQVHVDFSHDSGTIFVLPIQHSLYSDLETSRLNEMPLNTRAWTLQERYLSRRLLHFGQDQMYWECCCTMTGERGVSGVRASSVDGLLEGLMDKDYGVCLSSTTPPWIGSWLSLAESYSRRKLSIARDRFPALAGLARHVADRTGDRYCAGLWQGSFGYGLCWVSYFKGPEDSSKYDPERFLGPSWSWASTNVPVAYFSVSDGATLCAEFLSCELEIASQNPYGLVKGGRLKVKAPLVEIHPADRYSGPPFWDRGIAYPCFALILWDTPSTTAVVVKPTFRVDGEYWKVGLIPRRDRIPYSKDNIKLVTLV